MAIDGPDSVKAVLTAWFGMEMAHITDRQEVWVSYLLYDQGYVSREKAAELADLRLIQFNDFLRMVGEGERHYESGGVLWCENADGTPHFEFESHDPLKPPDECPHCGDTIE